MSSSNNNNNNNNIVQQRHSHHNCEMSYANAVYQVYFYQCICTRMVCLCVVDFQNEYIFWNNKHLHRVCCCQYAVRLWCQVCLTISHSDGSGNRATQLICQSIGIFNFILSNSSFLLFSFSFSASFLFTFKEIKTKKK